MSDGLPTRPISNEVGCEHCRGAVRKRLVDTELGLQYTLACRCRYVDEAMVKRYEPLTAHDLPSEWGVFEVRENGAWGDEKTIDELLSTTRGDGSRRALDGAADADE